MANPTGFVHSEHALPLKLLGTHRCTTGGGTSSRLRMQ